MYYELTYNGDKFQSTPSVWRETVTATKDKLRELFQSTPSVWRETESHMQHRRRTFLFQSTPSVWRETLRPRLCASELRYFNPLPPCGGRPMLWIAVFLCGYFNPLPPCGGRLDKCKVVVDSVNEYFNPLPPCGGRPLLRLCCRQRDTAFQSTPSVWRETPFRHGTSTRY